MTSGGIFAGFGRGGSPDDESPTPSAASPCPGGHFMMPDGECVQANCSPGLVFDSITSRCVPVGHTVDPADLPSSTPKPVPTVPSAPFDPTVDVGPLGPQKASMLMVGGAALLAAVVVGGVLLSSKKDEKKSSSTTAKANRRRYRRNPKGINGAILYGVIGAGVGFGGAALGLRLTNSPSDKKFMDKVPFMILGPAVGGVGGMIAGYTGIL